MPDIRKLGQDVKDTQVKFICTELAAGLTFATIARRAEGEERDKARYRARAAYDSVLRFIDRVTMNHSEAQQIHKDLKALQKQLEDLGETF